MEVTDYTAILAYLEEEYYRWNGIADLGTQTVVTYSFYESDTLPALPGELQGQTTYWSFDAAMRDAFRSALAEFQEAAGLIFVEVDGPAMINAYGYDLYSSTTGYAYYPGSTESYTSSGDLAIAGGGWITDSSQYDTILHEIGHGVGLAHPHDGEYSLADHLDTRDNTVMTYSAGQGTELGVFDIQALEHIYGSASAFDGWVVTGGGSSAVRIKATDAGDTILSTDVRTIIHAYGGNDTIQGREANDKVFAGSGADYVTGGAGDDIIYGGSGNDTVLGGNGNDTVLGSYGWDSIDGGNGDDWINGAWGRDNITGDWGNDSIRGGSGNDSLDGGSGDDYIRGGKNYDSITGGFGNDTLIGNQGNDTLDGGDGDDVMTGGLGADTFVFTNSDSYDANVITDFRSGLDVIDMTGTNFSALSQLSITTSESGTTLSYSNWFEIELSGFTGTLSADDFLFS